MKKVNNQSNNCKMRFRNCNLKTKEIKKLITVYNKKKIYFKKKLNKIAKIKKRFN